MNFGIYTLANDVVYDQLVALLNSIDVNINSDCPVCIIPYNDQIDKVKQEIKKRSNVTLFDNYEYLKEWDNFVKEIWQVHPKAKESKFSRPPWYQGFVHRKFASFNGNFDNFVFFDADSLAMKPIENILKKLESYDLVFDDWEHSKRGESTEVNVAAVADYLNCNESDIYPQLHCDSFFGSKRGLFDTEKLNNLKEIVIEAQVKGVRHRAWWSTSALFGYLTLLTNYSMFNFTLSPDPQDRTGNCADSDPFINQGNVLYNQEGSKPIHRIHYMNYSSAGFARLCQGEDVNIRYRDIFLHYRFLYEKEQKPRELKPVNLVTKAHRKVNNLSNKIKRSLG
jgi:hypothetical protein